MKISVRYFARLRETLGTSQEWVDTDAADVAGLHRQLMARGDNYQQALDASLGLRCALNQQLCGWDTPLRAQAEVAFFPPVTGG